MYKVYLPVFTDFDLAHEHKLYFDNRNVPGSDKDCW